VTATDVRPAVKEQVASLGAKFIAVEDEEFKQAETAGGYARKCRRSIRPSSRAGAEAHQEAGHRDHHRADPGRAAPRLISADMVKSMKPGSVIVDLADRARRQCRRREAGGVTDANGVKIVGYANMAGRLAASASGLYAKNLLNFLDILVDKKAKALAVNWDDEIVKATALTKDGAVVHPNFQPKTAAMIPQWGRRFFG